MDLPDTLSQFKTHTVNPIVPFFAMLYFRAQRILVLARESCVFHMLNIHIARQALHLVVILNDLAYTEDGLDDQQMDEREILEDELVELEIAMKDWSVIQGLHDTHRERSLAIEMYYSRVFRERFYFKRSRDPQNDPIFQSLLAYDTRATNAPDDVPEASRRSTWDNPASAQSSLLGGEMDRIVFPDIDWTTMEVPNMLSSPQLRNSTDKGSRRSDQGSKPAPTPIQRAYTPVMSETSGTSRRTTLDTRDSTGSEGRNIFFTHETRDPFTGSSDYEMDWHVDLNNTSTNEATPAQGREFKASEMSQAQWSAFNTTPGGPVNTCGYRDKFGIPCGKTIPRKDRFQHHVQAHFGVTPYACADSNKIAPELKCERRFSSVAERDTHVRNKVPVICNCTKEVKPRSLVRHQKICSVYLASLETATPDL